MRVGSALASTRRSPASWTASIARAAQLAASNLLVLVVGLFALEAGLRAFSVHFPAIPRGVFSGMIWQYDAVTGWAHVPGSSGRVDLGGPDQGLVRINSMGFRGPDLSLRRDPRVVRILAVGDSFVFGVGVDEEHLFATQLEKRLRDATGVPHEVVNLGVAGFSTDQQYLLLRERGLRLGPDFVLLLMCDNDFEGNVESFMYLRYYKPYFTIGPDHSLVPNQVPVPRLSGTQRLRLWLGERSEVWNFARSRESRWPPLRRALDGLEVDVSRESPEDPVRLTFLLVRGMRDLAAGAGAQFLTFNTAERGENTPLFIALRRHFRAAGVPFLGLEGPLSQAREARPQLAWDFGQDHHWNVEAQRLAAEIVAERVKAMRGQRGRVARDPASGAAASAPATPRPARSRSTASAPAAPPRPSAGG
jgi:hypothetical protein